MDLVEPRWRTNSSFSPPTSRIWDCRLQSDGLLHGSHGASVHGISLSSTSKGSRIEVGSDRYTNHHHSVSDGVLSYSGSPADNFQAPRWTSPVQKYNLGEFATPSMGGSRSETSLFPRSTERRYTPRASVASCSDGSPSSLFESGPWESTSKQPLTFSNRNFPSRRSFMSKPVYPLVFRNPVSDFETIGDTDSSSIGRLTPGDDRIPPSHWPDNSSSIEHKFHKTLTELQKVDTSTDASASSRREGFRWSSASSYDMGFDVENFDVAENMDLECLRSPNCSMEDQKCGVCGKPLWQKSPWSSNRIMRGGDMPVAGVLPCSHVFHAECLEQMTPKIQIHDPPCPLCLRIIGMCEELPSVSEPLLMALRSVRGSRGVVIPDGQENCSSDIVSNHIKDSTRRNPSRVGPHQKTTGSLIKSHFKKSLTFKGKMGKDFFRMNLFDRSGSSSSSREPVQHQISIK